MKRVQKWLASLLAVIMVIGMVPLSALAAEHDNQVRVIVENTTFTPETADEVGGTWDESFWHGTLVDTWVGINDESTMMSCVVDALASKGYEQKGAENNYISMINGLSEFDGGFMSGWMGTLNDWFTNEGFGAFTIANGKLEAGDEIRIMYTCSYGADLGGSWGDSDTTIKELQFSSGTLAPAFDKDTHEYTLNIPAGTTSVIVTPTASNKNYQVRTRIGDTVYKRTANVPVSDSTEIVVECNYEGSVSMNPDGETSAYTITVNIEEPQDVSAVLGEALAQMAENVAQPEFGQIGGEWAVLGLARSGYFDKDSTYFSQYYDRIVETVNETASELDMNGALHRNKSTENSRLILALSAIGKSSEAVGNWNLLAPFNENFKWITRQGINGPIFTLLALDSHGYQLTDTTVHQQCIDYILEKQLEDGGWALSGKKADPDITGMALQALAPYTDDEKVKTAIEEGINCLSAIQQEDGGYASWRTVNSESIAQVIVACTALGINPDTDARFIKNGKSALDALLLFYDRETKMFRHTADGKADQMATEQGVYALVAYDRFMNGQTSLYDMTDVKFAEEEEVEELAKAKENAKAELDSYKNASDYREAQKAELAKAIADGKAAIDKAGTLDEVNAALAAAKTVMDAIKTDVQLTAEDKEAIKAELQNHLSFLLQNTPNPEVGSIGGEWAVLALARAGYAVPENYFDNYYTNAKKFVKENINDKEQLHRVKSTENSRLILALTAIGKDVTDVAGHDLLAGLSDLDYLKKQGINGPIWALIALDSHGYEIPALIGNGTQATRENIIAYILDMQLEDGGWALFGKNADPDMTGMALQALAPYYETNADVTTAVDKALKCLSDIQLESGGFSSWGEGENIESCAQVIVALTALGVNPTTDAHFVKANGNPVSALLTFALKDGGFKHVASGVVDGMATEQGSYALVAYDRFLNGKTSLYDMSDVEINNNPDVPVPEDKDITLTDVTGTGVTVTGKESILNGMELEANLLTSGDLYDKVKESLKDGKFTLYDMYLLENNLVVQPDGTITVSIPVPDGYDGAKCKVYCVNADGSVTEITAVLKDGKLVLETDQMGAFVVYQPVAVDPSDPDENGNGTTTKPDEPDNNGGTDSPQTGDNSHVVLWFTVSLLSLATLTVLGRKKKAVK